MRISGNAAAARVKAERAIGLIAAPVALGTSVELVDGMAVAEIGVLSLVLEVMDPTAEDVELLTEAAPECRPD